MNGKGILIYFDSIDQLELIPDADRGRLLLDLLRYAKDGTLPEYDNPANKLMFSILQKRVDKDCERYEEVCRKRAEAGRKGLASRYGNKPVSNCQQMPANGSNCQQKVANDSKSTLNINIKDIYSSNEEHISNTLSRERVEREGEKMKRPTLEEVRQKMNELNYHRFTAEEFLAHYESNGWKVGRNPMKSWASCLVTWETTRKRQEEEKRGKERRSEDVNAYWENHS